MAKLRKTLGEAGSPYIVFLMRLIETQSKATLIQWCVDYSREYMLPIYEAAYPADERPRQALQAARDWLAGKHKLPAAKPYILAAHAAAREAEANPAAQAAARAVGQASAVIHSPTHSLGMVFYAAAARAYSSVGLNESAQVYESLAAQECAHMEAALAAMAVANEPNPAKIDWRC